MTEVVAEIEIILDEKEKRIKKYYLKLPNTNSIHSKMDISNNDSCSNLRERGSKRLVNMLRDNILTKKTAMIIQLSYSNQMHSGVSLQIIC